MKVYAVRSSQEGDELQIVRRDDDEITVAIDGWPLSMEAQAAAQADAANALYRDAFLAALPAVLAMPGSPTLKSELKARVAIARDVARLVVDEHTTSAELYG